MSIEYKPIPESNKDLASRIYFHAVFAKKSEKSKSAKVVNLISRYDGSTKYTISPAEFGVLTLIFEGFTNYEIARAKGITHQTAKNHVTSLFNKICVYPEDRSANRTDLVAKLAREGIVEFRPKIDEEKTDIFALAKQNGHQTKAAFEGR